MAAPRLRALRPTAICEICLARRPLRPPAIAGPSRSLSTTFPFYRNSSRQPAFGLSTDEPEEEFEDDSPVLPAFMRWPNPEPALPNRLRVADFEPKTPPEAHRLVEIMLKRLPDWTSSTRLQKKLESFGLDWNQAKRGVREWNGMMQDHLGGCGDNEEASAALSSYGWDEQALLLSFNNGDNAGFASSIEASFLRSLVTSLTTCSHVAEPLQRHLGSILEVTDLSRLAFNYDNKIARKMKRHFHLHIGPTNSGKTYNALKALAKAGTGAYAGPLRLLAHEVWERLNLGTVGDLNGRGKACNLLTGEERRIVDPDAGLISCTVEMLPLGAQGADSYDVVVVDEIQMLGDSQRGGSWMRAVLGVRAKEIHLCGDETTLELLESLIASFGDSLTIHRYERLTSLTVADESLNADWSKVQSGDCVVTFSRTGIFATKKAIEGTTGMKCAVVYGALPPETRAEQARLFNQDGSIMEVLVASDAVGMGLNLKIKRIIFESLVKFNGKQEVPLSLTQIKQIAGRAGRYGMHNAKTDQADTAPRQAAGHQVDEEGEGNEEGKEDARTSELQETDEPNKPDEEAQLGGEVTTWHKSDLPILRALLNEKLPSIKRANVDVPFAALSDLYNLLTPNTSFGQLLDNVSSLALLPWNMKATSMDAKGPLAGIIEQFRDRLSLPEMDLLSHGPVSHRDPLALDIFRNIVSGYANKGLVEVDQAFATSRLLHTLDMVEGTIAVLPPLPPTIGIGRRLLFPPILASSIPHLESLHKSLVLYIWLSYRLDVALPDRDKALVYKDRTEVVLEICLERLPGVRNKLSAERGMAVDRPVAQWRRANVAPRGTQKWDNLGGRKGVEWEPRHIAERLKARGLLREIGVPITPEEARQANERDLEGGEGPQLIGRQEGVDSDQGDYGGEQEEPRERRATA